MQDTKLPTNPALSTTDHASQTRTDDLIIGDKIAQGAFGQVYDACFGEDDCRYIVKIQPVNLHGRFDELGRETEIAHTASLLGVGPRIIQSFACENFETHAADVKHVGLIVMEKWPMTLQSFLKEHESGMNDRKKKKLLTDVEAQIKTLLKHGIWHRDLSLRNVLVQQSSGIPNAIAITDYGQSVSLEEESDPTILQV